MLAHGLDRSHCNCKLNAGDTPKLTATTSAGVIQGSALAFVFCRV